MAYIFQPVATVSSTQRTNVVAPMQSQPTIGQSGHTTDSLLNINQSGLLTDPATLMSLNQSALPTDSASALNLSLMNSLAYQQLLLNQAVSANQAAQPSDSLNNALNPDYLNMLPGNMMPGNMMNPLLMPGLAGSMGGLGGMNTQNVSMGRGQRMQLPNMYNIRATSPVSGAGTTGSQGDQLPNVGMPTGILPGLMPLLQSLTLGDNNQTPRKDL